MCCNFLPFKIESVQITTSAVEEIYEMTTLPRLAYWIKSQLQTTVRTATATADHGLIYKCGEGGLPPSPQAIPISVDMTTATAYLHLNILTIYTENPCLTSSDKEIKLSKN